MDYVNSCVFPTVTHPGKIKGMDSVDHPLDWWALGGYARVMRETGLTKPQARRAVHKTIANYYRRTGNPIWHPFGHRGYTQLKRAIMDGLVLDNDLT